MNDVLRDLLLQVLRLEAHTDSLEIGSASKGGVVKVYGNFEDPDAFRKKLDAALELRRYAQRGIAEGDGA